ncbi:mobile element protein [Paenibacillus pini JCM 16418]|uniref:Mobile element protein n=1 Tax=Paenibacillus pini JCM 16418 TaxID=1236976 RepID=W7YZL3_9BACL|nr:mobile element protein [Paenibacillus pini JCM 16418]
MVKWKYDQPSQNQKQAREILNNRGFRRFLLRGMEKVTLEVGWRSLAHNLLKQAANDQKRKAAILQ